MVDIRFKLIQGQLMAESHGRKPKHLNSPAILIGPEKKVMNIIFRFPPKSKRVAFLANPVIEIGR